MVSDASQELTYAGERSPLSKGFLFFKDNLSIASEQRNKNIMTPAVSIGLAVEQKTYNVPGL